MDLRALILMPAVVGVAVFGFVFLLFACNYYLTVLESTAAGAKEIPWVREPITDNFWKLWYLGWIVGLWLGPAFLVGRTVAVGIDSAWAQLLASFLVLWLCYPVSQLSSLSASSVWLPLVPDVFFRLAQKPAVVLQFFILSAVVLLVFALGFKWTFQTEGEWHLLFIGAPLVVLAALFYARLLGRLAFVLRYTKGLFPTKRRQKVKAGGEPAEKPTGAPKPKRTQPRDMPPIQTPDGELAGYDVNFEDDTPPAPKKRVKAEMAEAEAEPEAEPPAEQEPPPLRRRPTPASAVERSRVWTEEDDEETTGYGVHEAEVKPEERIPEEVLNPSAAEMRLLSRSDVPKKPKRVWGAELLVFLGQPATISALVIASGLCCVVGAMVRIVRQFNPATGGE